MLKKEDPPVTEEGEKANEGPNFTDAPAFCECPHCTRSVVTQVEFQSGWQTYVMCLVVFLLCGWLTICVLPFLFPVFQDVCHFCPRCLNLIHRSQRVKFPSIRNEVVTVKCGNCAIVLSRRYVVFLGLMMAVLTGVYAIRWYLLNVGLPDIERGSPTKATWDEFLQHCGFQSALGNPIHAMGAFGAHFAQRTVNWKGRVMRVQEGIFAKNFLYVIMEPAQFRRRDMPDIALMFNAKLNPMMEDLSPGDEVVYNATLVELGRRGRPHLGYLWEILRTRRAEEMPPMVPPPQPLFIRFGPALPDVQRRLVEMRKSASKRGNGPPVSQDGSNNAPPRVVHVVQPAIADQAIEPDQQKEGVPHAEAPVQEDVVALGENDEVHHQQKTGQPRQIEEAKV